MTPQDVLNIELGLNDAGAGTIRDYLVVLLEILWQEGEGFSGKRPFGNSGWEYDLYRALIKAGAVRGKLDEWDGVEDVDDAAADALVLSAIHALHG